MNERERKVQERIMKITRKYGSYTYKNAQNMYTEKGRPDLTACVPVPISELRKLFGDDGVVGIFVGIEVKRDGLLGNVSEAQKIVGEQIKKAKGLWFAVDNSEFVEGLMLRLTGNKDGV